MGDTLTQMLKTELLLDEPDSKAEADANEYELAAIKEVFKEWLRTVTAMSVYGTEDDVDRALLITLVDEP